MSKIFKDGTLLRVKVDLKKQLEDSFIVYEQLLKVLNQQEICYPLIQSLVLSTSTNPQLFFQKTIRSHLSAKKTSKDQSQNKYNTFKESYNKAMKNFSIKQKKNQQTVSKSNLAIKNKSFDSSFVQIEQDNENKLNKYKIMLECMRKLLMHTTNQEELCLTRDEIWANLRKKITEEQNNLLQMIEKFSVDLQKQKIVTKLKSKIESVQHKLKKYKKNQNTDIKDINVNRKIILTGYNSKMISLLPNKIQ